MRGSPETSTTCGHLAAPVESQSARSASLFPDDGLAPHECRLLGLLKADLATHIDELIEKLETETSSSEIFAALFALELNGKVRQMPGENFVKRVASSTGANIREECSKTASEFFGSTPSGYGRLSGVNSNTTVLLDMIWAF